MSLLNRLKGKAGTTTPSDQAYFQEILAILQQILAVGDQIDGKATKIMAAQDDINAAITAINSLLTTVGTVVTAIQQSVTDIQEWEQANAAVDTSGLNAVVANLAAAGTSLTGAQADVASVDLENPPASSAEAPKPEASA